MTIDSFEGRYRFLSNFSNDPVHFAGFTWPTSEHAYQAMKTDDPKERAVIFQCSTPNDAKKVGRRVTIRDDWEGCKDDYMLAILRRKFSNADLARRLLDTVPHKLVEGNWWGDTYWGVCNGRGLNKLGIMLMQVRVELQFEYGLLCA